MKKTTYTVELTWVGNNKLQVIKTFREINSIGLKEANDKVMSAPCVILETTSQAEAERYKKTLEECGAIVTVSKSTEEVTSKKAGLKKIGVDFIILSMLVIVGCAALVSAIPYIMALIDGVPLDLVQWDFFGFLFVFAFSFSVIWILSNFCIISKHYDGYTNNKITDRIVAKTVKKNNEKHGFVLTEVFHTVNATLIIDLEDSGKIAYVSNLNPWKFQVISAKDIDNIKSDYKTGLSSETTHYVYFQFAYQGKVMKFPTFVSGTYRPLEMECVRKGRSNAAFYEGLLKDMRYNLNKEEHI